jgi:hypothetical protein
MLLISNYYIFPLNIPFVFVQCDTIATFAHWFRAAYFVAEEANMVSMLTNMIMLEILEFGLHPNRMQRIILN